MDDKWQPCFVYLVKMFAITTAFQEFTFIMKYFFDKSESEKDSAGCLLEYPKRCAQINVYKGNDITH